MKMSTELELEKMGFRTWLDYHGHIYLHHQIINFQASLRLSVVENMTCEQILGEFIKEAIKFGMREAAEDIKGKIDDANLKCLAQWS